MARRSFARRNRPQFDYEGEIVLVIGKSGRRIAEAHALDHVFGLTLMNEGSVRDWLRHGKFNVTQGKNFDSSGAIGPWIVPRAEIPDLRPISRSSPASTAKSASAATRAR